MHARRGLALVVGLQLAIAVAVVTLLAGPSGSPGQFWAAIDGYPSVEAETYESYEAMARLADAVVLGRIEAVRPGRSWLAEEGPSDDYDLYVTYADAKIVIDDVLANAGKLDLGAQVVIEFTVQRPEDAGIVGRLLPVERGIFFLREKGREAERLGLPKSVVDAERGRYRLVNSAGVVHDANAVVWLPDAASETGLREWEGRRFEDLIRVVAG